MAGKGNSPFGRRRFNTAPPQNWDLSLRSVRGAGVVMNRMSLLPLLVCAFRQHQRVRAVATVIYRRGRNSA